MELAVSHGFHEQLSELSSYFVLAFCGKGTSCFGQAPILASYKFKWIKNILGHWCSHYGQAACQQG